MDLVEQVLHHNRGEPGVVVLDRLVEPRKGLVSLAAESVNIGDVPGNHRCRPRHVWKAERVRRRHNPLPVARS